MIVYLSEREYRRVAFERVRKHFLKFRTGHRLVYSYNLFTVFAVEPGHSARVRVKARGDERVYLVLFAYRAQQKFGRRRADDCGEIAVLRAEERIYSLFVLLPELFDHLFRVHKAQEAEESALHLVAAYLQKEAGEADELIGKNDYQPRVPD